MNKKVLPVIVFLLIIVAFLGGVKWTILKNKGGRATPTPTPSKPAEAPSSEKPNYPTTVGNFLVTDSKVCLENGKPIIYYFGASSCSHCRWEEPIVKKVAEKFSNLISFHNNIDTQNDMEVFQKYSDINPGYIPFLVFGCKYARLGSGEQEGEAKEEENLTALICQLTDLKPERICKPFGDKIGL